MLFTKLKLNYFGKFHNKEIELKQGINLIYGDNEAGKSTIHTFIKGMLFGIDKLRGRAAASKDDLYMRYLPWEYPGAFSGSMDIILKDKEYRLIRSFHTSDKAFTILDLSTGREFKLKDGHISELIPQLTESTFRNTISIEQLKAQTDSQLADQVRNYITNLSIAKSKEIDVAKAVSFLNEQRRALETSQNKAVLKTLEAEIKEGLEREARLDSLSLSLQEMLQEEQRLQAQLDQKNASIDSQEAVRGEQLPAILEKYHLYRDLERQGQQIERQCIELRDKISALEKEDRNIELLKEEIKGAIKLTEEIRNYEIGQSEVSRERENLRLRTNRRYLLIALIPAGVIALLTMIFTGFTTMGLYISAMGIMTGFIIFVALSQQARKQALLFQERLDTLQEQVSAAKSGVAHILQRNKVQTLEELSAKHERQTQQAYTLKHIRQQLLDLKQRGDELEDKRDALYDSIMGYLRYYVVVDELTDQGIERLKEEIHRRKQEEFTRDLELKRQMEVCRLSIERLRWEISALEGNEEQLIRNRERYESLEQKQKEDELELAAIKLALNTIQDLSADIHDSFGLQLNKAISGIISEVTGQRYTDIKLDEKLELKVGWKGDYVPLDRLSSGTIDQFYLSLRLAVADLLLGEESMPLLLDDSFAMYDDNRLRTTINQIKEREQILLFSCQQREKELLEELKLPYQYVDLSEE